MTTAFDPQPVTLAGRHVRIEPLSLNHTGDLLRAGREESIWSYMPNPAFRNIEDVKSWIAAARTEADSGQQIPFAIIDTSSSAAVGSTRLLNIRRPHRCLEIGYTWLAISAQRSAINTECKLLLLEYAFETLGAVRVEFKTDARNERSQRALERIGAFREGVFRRHMIMWNGHVRDSVYYSILDREWPVAKARLKEKLKH